MGCLIGSLFLFALAVGDLFHNTALVGLIFGGVVLSLCLNYYFRKGGEKNGKNVSS